MLVTNTRRFIRHFTRMGKRQFQLEVLAITLVVLGSYFNAAALLAS